MVAHIYSSLIPNETYICFHSYNYGHTRCFSCWRWWLELYTWKQDLPDKYLYKIDSHFDSFYCWSQLPTSSMSISTFLIPVVVYLKWVELYMYLLSMLFACIINWCQHNYIPAFTCIYLLYQWIAKSYRQMDDHCYVMFGCTCHCSYSFASL